MVSCGNFVCWGRQLCSLICSHSRVGTEQNLHSFSVPSLALQQQWWHVQPHVGCSKTYLSSSLSCPNVVKTHVTTQLQYSKRITWISRESCVAFMHTPLSTRLAEIRKLPLSNYLRWSHPITWKISHCFSHADSCLEFSWKPRPGLGSGGIALHSSPH
jgi:hypothetical protein